MWTALSLKKWQKYLSSLCWEPILVFALEQLKCASILYSTENEIHNSSFYLLKLVAYLFYYFPDFLRFYLLIYYM